MAKRISIRGVIVGSAYDTEWAADYIQRGIFTPESAFQRALAEAGGDPVEIYISSQGGDVVAGGEIRNAIAEYPGEKCVVVGAFAVDVGGVRDAGASYVFVRSGTAWTQQQRLPPPREVQDRQSSLGAHGLCFPGGVPSTIPDATL